MYCGVDVELIAMATDHVPHHLPSPPSPSFPFSLPPIAITHVREMTPEWSLCHCLQHAEYIHLQPPIVRTRCTLSLTVGLFVSLFFHLSLVIFHLPHPQQKTNCWRRKLNVHLNTGKVSEWTFISSYLLSLNLLTHNRFKNVQTHFVGFKPGV